MIPAILVAGPGDYRQRGVDCHRVGVRGALHVLIGDVDLGLAHVVVGLHAAAVQAHVVPTLSSGPESVGSWLSRAPSRVGGPAWLRVRRYLRSPGRARRGSPATSWSPRTSPRPPWWPPRGRPPPVRRRSAW